MKSLSARPGPEKPTLLASQDLYQLSLDPRTFQPKAVSSHAGTAGVRTLWSQFQEATIFSMSHGGSLVLLIHFDVFMGQSELKLRSTFM